MGEVYRARDTRLDRSVAIKILPPALASDAQLRERFEREARAISSLHHPHICALYDVGAAVITATHDVAGAVALAGGETIRFLVLELLEGETLEARLRRSGPLPLAEAIRIALQVCDALDEAHGSGIVHRDLKPGNVFLERVGGSAAFSAKLLDFGLAKAASPARPVAEPSLPTTPASLTAQGTVLGTFQYMAPEQVEGLEADARSDIFALGVTLFEMLTGRRAFDGRSRAALLGAILKDDPPPPSTIAPAVPKAVDRVIATCLAKDPGHRWQNVRDLGHALRVASIPPPDDGLARPPRRSITTLTGVALVTIALLVGAAAGLILAALQRARPAAPPIAFAIFPPPDQSFSTPPGGGTGLAPQAAVSPDGRRVVFVAEGPDGHLLWVRELGSPEARRIPGTSGGTFPFWSPDNRNIGFFTRGKLKRVSVAGGWPQDVCDAPDGRGGTWNKDNVIVFTSVPTGGLQRVSAAGGTPVTISQLDTQYGETSHRFPWFLPDGRHFLYTAAVGTCCPAAVPARVKIGALDSADATMLMQVESAVAYAAEHVVFNRDGTLMAQPFDPARRSLRGEPFPVVDGVSSEGSRYASFSLSASGTLLYARGGQQSRAQLTWMDRSGRPLKTVGELAAYSGITLSPDDAAIATTFRAQAADASVNIHVIDAERGDVKRATFERVQDFSPIWSHDGQHLVFVGRRDGGHALNLLKIRTLQEEILLRLASAHTASGFRPTDWSRDGRYIIGTETFTASGSMDLWTLTADRRERRPYVETPAHESNAAFSPDGKWVAYEVTDTGPEGPQIFVRRFPATDEKHQVSTGGGVQPLWGPDGREIFFLAPTGEMSLMSAEVTLGDVFESRPPRRLFPVQTMPSGGLTRQYAVGRDGKRFLVAVRQQLPSAPLTVVVNWSSDLK
jgi:Tol biopolymer transport system component